MGVNVYGYWHGLGYRMVMVMNDIQLAFYELFFGIQGGWIGFLLVASIMLLVTAKVKHAGILFMVVSVMMGVMMNEELAVNNDLIWCMLMYFSMPIFLLLVMVKGGKSSF